MIAATTVLASFAGGPVAIAGVAPQARSTPAPIVTVSGPAFDARTEFVRSGVLALHAEATEPNVFGATIPPGIVSISTLVDGLASPDGPAANEDCPQGRCALMADGTIDIGQLAAGEHIIDVDAMDAAGTIGHKEWLLGVATTPSNGPACTPNRLPTSSGAGIALPTPTGVVLVGLPMFTGFFTNSALSMPGVGGQSAPSILDAQTVAPRFAQSGDEFYELGSPNVATVPADGAGGFSLGAGDRAICVSPTLSSSQAPAGQGLGSAVVFANTGPSTTTILLPGAAGVESIQQIGGTVAPHELSWDLTLRPSETLEQINPNMVAIVDTQSPVPASSDVRTMLPALPDASSSAWDQLVVAANAQEYAQSNVIDGAVVAAVQIGVQSAAGQDVPATVSADTVSGRIILTVSYASGPDIYPLVVRSSWTSTTLSFGSEPNGAADFAAAGDPHAPPGTCKVQPTRPFKTGRDPGTLYGDATASCNWTQIQWWKASTCIQKLHHFLIFNDWQDESGSCDNHENHQHPNNPSYVAYMQGHHACVRTANTHTWRTDVKMQIKLFGAGTTNASFPSGSLDSKC